MRPDSVRLLLAGQLRLGEPLRTALPLSENARQIVLDSTLEAWKQIQTIAIDRNIDALILNGNTVVAEHLNPVAEFALIEGLELLAEAGIPVVVQCGDTDPRSFWKELIADLNPERRNITLISPQESGGYLLVQDDEYQTVVPQRHSDQLEDASTLARIILITDVLPDFQNEQDEYSDDSDPPVIAIEHGADDSITLPPGVNLKFANQSAVWATDGVGPIQQDRFSAPQPLSLEEADQNAESGCLLIDIPVEGEIQTEHLPTAIVQFHAAELDLSACDDWDDAALTLQNQLEDLPWEPHERLRLVTWSIVSNDSLSKQIISGDDSHLIAAWNESFTAHHHDTVVIHGFQPGGQLPLDLDSACSGQELAEALFEIEQSADQPEVDRLAAVWSTDKSSAALLTRLRPVLNPAQIGNYAESVVTQWLTQSDPENLPHENHTS